MTTNQLSGQVAIVTGGGRGFGQAIARALAAGGAAVTVTSRTPSQVAETAAAIEAAGGRALALQADVNSQDDWQRVVRETESKLGPVTLLVANAALSDPAGPIYEADPDVWQKTLDTNVMGSVRGARAVLPGMVSRGAGRLIIISSGAALAATPYTSPYRVSKAALLRLAEILALEVKDHGISVFAIHPGVINSTILDSAVRTEEGRKWVPHMARMVESGTALTGTEQCAECCVFLASGAADALSGRYLSATEDYRALAAR
ncbi:MAG TPA: SDR family oxidoreductase, partial [Dehalococcoidia bacterium]|nr:SDR family oxidoreductase [Dehalococcoidia bacterium]